MLTIILEGIIGFLMFNICARSIKKSVIRKWREGFFFLLAASGIAMLHSGLSLIGIFPEILNTVFFTIMIGANVYGIFSISRSRLPD